MADLYLREVATILACTAGGLFVLRWLRRERLESHPVGRIVIRAWMLLLGTFVLLLSARLLEMGSLRAVDGVIADEKTTEFPAPVRAAPPTTSSVTTGVISTPEGHFEIGHPGMPVGQRVCVTLATGKITGIKYLIGYREGPCKG
jgi:hypothetical protein